jgi:hypothetical protein
LGKTVQVFGSCLFHLSWNFCLCSYSSTDHPNDFTFKVVPHITNAIQEWIERVAMIPVDGMEGPADVCVIELGGTIGGMR